ncbi:MAG: hypothetical protein MZV49_12555 [Rhodopseudomonas palustris]|nr:hypothetical protein [Rhodopseudomonas palustris]
MAGIDAGRNLKAAVQSSWGSVLYAGDHRNGNARATVRSATPTEGARAGYGEMIGQESTERPPSR